MHSIINVKDYLNFSNATKEIAWICNNLHNSALAGTERQSYVALCILHTYVMDSWPSLGAWRHLQADRGLNYCIYLRVNTMALVELGISHIVVLQILYCRADFSIQSTRSPPPQDTCASCSSYCSDWPVKSSTLDQLATWLDLTLEISFCLQHPLLNSIPRLPHPDPVTSSKAPFLSFQKYLYLQAWVR